MLRPRLVIVVTCLTIAIQPAIETASAARKEDPLRYRYAGVVENGRGAPSHFIEAGDRFRFVFFDWLSKGRRSEPYRLCIGRIGKVALRCSNHTAAYGVGGVTFAATPPAILPVATPLTARWLIGGRIVATWRFYYMHGG
jgi:hypothetical protein